MLIVNESSNPSPNFSLVAFIIWESSMLKVFNDHLSPILFFNKAYRNDVGLLFFFFFNHERYHPPLGNSNFGCLFLG